LLLANPEILEIINWEYLSGNPAPEALELLAAHEDKIDWWMLSGNPKLFELVEMLRQNELLEAMQAELDRNYVRPVGDIVQGPYAIHVPLDCCKL
jgi:hypothetical protein